MQQNKSNFYIPIELTVYYEFPTNQNINNTENDNKNIWKIQITLDKELDDTIKYISIAIFYRDEIVGFATYEILEDKTINLNIDNIWWDKEEYKDIGIKLISENINKLFNIIKINNLFEM